MQEPIYENFVLLMIKQIVYEEMESRQLDEKA